VPTIIDFKPNVRKGSYELETQGLGVRKRFVDEYLIRGGANENEDTILATSGLPTLWSFTRGAFCQKMSADEDETHAGSGSLWTARFEYDSKIDSDNQSQGGVGGGGLPDFQPPENLQPKWSWSSEEIEEVIETDQIDTDPVTGKLKPIINKVGEKLLLTRPVQIPVLTITRFQASFSPSTIYNFASHVNSEEFWGFPPHTALMGTPVDSPYPFQNRTIRQVQYTIKFNTKKNRNGDLIGWKSEVLHEGWNFWEYVPNQGIVVKKPFKDKHGHRYKGLLTPNGEQLPPNLETGEYNPNYLEFNRFPETDFNALSLGPWGP
jgi:hypothetical protein